MMSMLDRTAARIDRRPPVPFYFQLKQLIRDEIAGERWLPGERIPSEHALCDHFSVSRTTVRQALAELESEGLLVKLKGRGTFVAEPRSSSWFLQSSHGFHDEATRAGREVTSRVMRVASSWKPCEDWRNQELERGSATKVPRPFSFTNRPSLSSSASAWRTVVRETEK